MHPRHPRYHLPLRVLAALALAYPWFHLPAATLTAPPAVVYGRVIHVGNGAAYQVYDGTLEVEIERLDDPGHVVSLQTGLARIGRAGEFSYRLEVPVKHQPEADEFSSALEVGFEPSHYRVRSLAVDGAVATPLDALRAALTVSFEDRAAEHRLDMEVSLPQPDTDGDGAPDWWEELHGFNLHLAADAAADPDGDGIVNLEEFRGGTDPNVANTSPLVLSTSLVVPAGGTGGFNVHVVDADTPPGDLAVTFISIPDGVALRSGGSPLAAGATATYAEVLAGSLTVAAEPGFTSGTLALRVEESGGPGAAEVDLPVLAFSPGTLPGAAPAVWLDAGSFAAPGDVAEWADRSPGGRDAYQPRLADRPATTAAGEVTFGGGDYLFLDERDLDTDEFTAFLAFRPDAAGLRQTIVRTGTFEVALGAFGDANLTGSLAVSGAGRAVRGGFAGPGAPVQLTVGAGAGATFASTGGGGFVSTAEVPVAGLVPAGFSTVGGRRGFAGTTADALFAGALHELLVYRGELHPALRTRNEDYQLSRWGDLVVWDFRNQVVPLAVSGSTLRPNALSGGWSHDSLTGGQLDDVLRGGPGDDSLTGRSGADRFQVFTGGGSDTVTDFNPEQGDVLDLTGVFGGLSGSPSGFVRLRSRVTRDTGAEPRVDTAVELDHTGPSDGWQTDQIVTLAGRGFGDGDLRRLVGEGSVELGGPQFETAFEFVGIPDSLVENGHPHPVVLRRSGNLDAALEVALSFTGTATAGTDIAFSSPATVAVPGAPSNTMTLRFERGAAEVPFDLVALVDITAEEESVAITVLDGPKVTAGAAAGFPLTEPPFFAIREVVNGRLGEPVSDARVTVVRGGPGTDAAASVPATITAGASGTRLVAGPGAVEFAAGVTEVEVVLPRSAVTAPVEGEVPVAHLTLEPTAPHQVVHGPLRATALFLAEGAVEAPTFADWREGFFPGDTSPGLAGADHDGDGRATLLEFVQGTSPVARDFGEPTGVDIRVEDGHAILEIRTTTGWSDVQLSILGSGSLDGWRDVTAGFDLTVSVVTAPGPDGVLLRTYRSREPATAGGHFRIAAHLLQGGG